MRDCRGHDVDDRLGIMGLEGIVKDNLVIMLSSRRGCMSLGLALSNRRSWLDIADEDGIVVDTKEHISKRDQNTKARDSSRSHRMILVKVCTNGVQHHHSRHITSLTRSTSTDISEVITATVKDEQVEAA